jgi:hypothetical protein
MMIRRATWLFLAVFIILAGFAWYILRPKPLAQDQVPSLTVSKLLPGITTDSVKALSLTNGKGLEVILEKGNDKNWLQKKPVINPLTQGNIQEILSQVVAINIFDILETPPPASAVGLDNPSYTLVLTTDQEIQIKIGVMTPTGSGYYIQVGQTQPVIVSKPGIDRLIEIFLMTQTTPTPPPTRLPSETTTSTSTGY